MTVTLIKTRWVSGNLEFLDSAGDRIAYFDSANRSFAIDAAAALVVGSGSLSIAELTFLDAITAGSITASKAVTRDAGSRIPLATAVPAAAGTNAATATAITADVNLVTAADGTKGVILPVGVAGMAIRVVNTVTPALLKVYPDTGGNINALGANVAFDLAAGQEATFVCTAALTWYVAKIAVPMSGDATQDGAGALTIAALAVDNAKIATAAAIARTKLATDTTQKYALDVVSDAGAALLAAETAGTFNRSIAANVQLIQGEITDNETEASVGYAQFTLPPEYVAAGAVVLRIPCKVVLTAAAVDNGSTIDAEVFESDGAGAVGADICATAAQTFAALDTWYNKDFTVTATGLLPGDVLNIKITATIIDSEAGGGTLRFNMETPQLLISVQG